MTKKWRSSDRRKGFPLGFSMPMAHSDELLPVASEFGYYSGTKNAMRGGLTELGCIAYRAPAVCKDEPLRKRIGSLVVSSTPSLHNSRVPVPSRRSVPAH